MLFTLHCTNTTKYAITSKKSVWPPSWNHNYYIQLSMVLLIMIFVLELTHLIVITTIYILCFLPIFKWTYCMTQPLQDEVAWVVVPKSYQTRLCHHLNYLMHWEYDSGVSKRMSYREWWQIVLRASPSWHIALGTHNTNNKMEKKGW